MIEKTRINIGEELFKKMEAGSNGGQYGIISKNSIYLEDLSKEQIKILLPLLQQIEDEDLVLNLKTFLEGFLPFYEQLTILEKR